jgi:hypothetical protein
MRRYCVHNMLRYMWVLTYAEAEYDHRVVMRDVRLFLRRLRRELDVPVYLYAPEPHPQGHGWHCNVFVDRRLPHAVVKRAWLAGGARHGFELRVKDWAKERRHGPLRERVRAGAMYGAKYAGKDVAELAVYGVQIGGREHRYEVAQGARPRWTMSTVRSESEAIGTIMREHGTICRVINCSQEVGGGLWIRFAPHPPP